MDLQRWRERERKLWVVLELIQKSFSLIHNFIFRDLSFMWYQGRERHSYKNPPSFPLERDHKITIMSEFFVHPHHHLFNYFFFVFYDVTWDLSKWSRWMESCVWKVTWRWSEISDLFIVTIRWRLFYEWS